MRSFCLLIGCIDLISLQWTPRPRGMCLYLRRRNMLKEAKPRQPTVHA